MRVEKYVAMQWALRIEKVVIIRTKRQLKQMGRECTLSGDYSGLQNPWDEICAQQQSEKSFYWMAYQGLIEEILLSHVERLERAALLALWSETDQGRDWLCDHNMDENGHEHAPAIFEDVVHHLSRLLLQMATDEDYPQISRYFYD